MCEQSLTVVHDSPLTVAVIRINKNNNFCPLAETYTESRPLHIVIE